MLDTFVVSFRLRNTYKANSIIWSLKGIPLLGRLLPSSLYADRGLKIFGNVMGGLIELFLAFAGKGLYLFVLWSQVLNMEANQADSFVHMLIFTTIIGGFLNTYIFEPTKDKYYAIFLMRMNARQYTLTSYLYFMLKMLIGFVVFSITFGAMSDVSLPICIVIPVYVLCVKLCFTAYSLYDCKKKNKIFNENSFPFIKCIFIAALLAFAATPYAGYAFPEWTLYIITAVMIIPSAFAFKYILYFDSYRQIYKELLKPENYIGSTGTSAGGAAQQIAMQKKIADNINQTSNKSGYKYFNELFMKRHSKILTRSAKRITLGAALIMITGIIALYIYPQAKPDINEMLMTYLPYFLFVMYLINRGRVITQAMFMNCDHSMLTYRFYRQPKSLLALFAERLKYVILINLMPALVIALGLPILLYVTGGTEEPLNYIILSISIISMSVFFSVHNMVLYYLLQPYNVNLESKSAVYSIINWVTYMVSYMAIQVKLPTLAFGSAITIFCVAYVIVALLFAYKLAPKTFKLRY